MKSFFCNGSMFFKLENGRIHGFALTKNETAWIHRELSEFDLKGAVQVEESDYLAQVEKFKTATEIIWKSKDA